MSMERNINLFTDDLPEGRWVLSCNFLVRESDLGSAFIGIVFSIEMKQTASVNLPQ